jgi:hypothetical protein
VVVENKIKKLAIVNFVQVVNLLKWVLIQKCFSNRLNRVQKYIIYGEKEMGMIKRFGIAD